MRLPKWLTVVGLTLFVVVSCSTAFGQGNNPLKAGKKALQFQIGPDVRLTSLEGTAITYKKHTSETKAWRIGISPTISVSGGETTFDDTLNADIDGYNYRLDVVFQLMKYRPVSNSATFFYGFGPTAGFNFSSSNQGSPTSTQREADLSSFFFGGTFALGVEWFLSKAVSLSGEYGLRAKYEKSKTTRTYTSPTRPTFKEVREESRVDLNASQIKLGVSVYFD